MANRRIPKYENYSENVTDNNELKQEIIKNIPDETKLENEEEKPILSKKNAKKVITL